jgi:uncharacterized membrane protein SirB2
MALSYLAIKQVHMSAAALSISLFLLRGFWMLRMPARLRQRWVKVIPHVVDTVLLGAALWMAWQLGAGARQPWLVAKIVGLLVYIVLGTIALKRGRTPRARALAFIGAILVFGYIVMVALTKTPWGIFGRM